MPLKSIFCFATVIFILYSCGPSKEEMEYRENSLKIAHTLKERIPDLATDTIDGITHNFIRTADLQLKVNNVLAVSNAIEDLVKAKGGYISSSDLSSTINYTTSIKFEKDSLLESTYYTTVNALTLKVPNKQLDTVLRAISNMAQFIHYRRLKADDVKMSLYANQLAENRYKNYQTNIQKKANVIAGNLKENLNAQDKLLEKQTLIDNAKIDSYELADKVNYSTLSLELYQPEQVSSLTKYILPPPVVYSPSFFEQLGNSFIEGGKILKNCLLFIVSIWGLIFFIIVLLVLMKKTRTLIGRLSALLK